jgi:triosephosphate isomerase
MRKPFVAGNWKMNGSRASVKTLLDGLMSGIDSVANAEVAVCPPAIFIPDVAEMLEGGKIAWGGQNVCDQDSGAFTGEIAVSMLKDYGCQYVIIGHSERRAIYGESDQLVAAKVAKAIESGITPILCVGELLEEREAGDTEKVVERQLAAVVETNGIKALGQTVIAYEPVWAIGTGKTATPDQAQEVHAFIRSWIGKQDKAIADGIRILYGGSVKGANAAELFSQPDVDGGLIGGASLNADEFMTICNAA